MTLLQKIKKAAFSTEVVLLAFLLVCFVFVQAFYPEKSWLQSIGLTVVVIVVRVLFKISEAKDTEL